MRKYEWFKRSMNCSKHDEYMNACVENNGSVIHTCSIGTCPHNQPSTLLKY